MPKLKGLTVSIVVNGNELPEIADEEVEDCYGRKATSTRYVQVSEGDQFGIKIKVDKHYRVGKADGLEYNVSLDGIDTWGLVFGKDDELCNLPYEYTDHGRSKEREGQWFVQHYQFSKLRAGV